MECKAFLIHLQGYTKEFRYIMVKKYLQHILIMLGYFKRNETNKQYCGAFLNAYCKIWCDSRPFTLIGIHKRIQLDFAHKR